MEEGHRRRLSMKWEHIRCPLGNDKHLSAGPSAQEAPMSGDTRWMNMTIGFGQWLQAATNNKRALSGPKDN